MALDARLSAWLALHLVDGVGSRTFHILLQTFGSAEAVISAPSAMLAKHLPSQLIESLKAGPDAALVEQTQAWLTQADHHLLAWDDAAYPAQLLTIADPPPLIYAM